MSRALRGSSWETTTTANDGGACVCLSRVEGSGLPSRVARARARTGSAASYSGAMELSGANMRANVVRPASEPRLRVKPSQNRHRWQSGFPRSTSAECFCSKMPMLVSTVLATENPMPSNVVLAMLLWPAGN